MYDITTSSNTTLPVYTTQDYSNTDTSLAVKTYRIETSSNPITILPESMPRTTFAQAIYGDGPYSLIHPNTASDILCQNIDTLA